MLENKHKPGRPEDSNSFNQPKSMSAGQSTEKGSQKDRPSEPKKEPNTGGFPQQHQDQQPGLEHLMEPTPLSAPKAPPDKLLKGKTAIITGGDSGIGKAIALLFARHGANICIVYLNEHEDAKTTQSQLQATGAWSLLLSGDITNQCFCQSVIEQVMAEFGHIDILINNAGVQFEQDTPEDITSEQLLTTFSTNVFAAFYFILAALPFMKAGSSIINTTSITAYKGNKSLIDYSATKGALLALTRSLSTALIDRQIRVNAVAPGPIWTPLIPASFSKQKVEQFGKDVPMGRAGQPEEVAPCYLFLASDQASYMTGQVLHPNGGVLVGG